MPFYADHGIVLDVDPYLALEKIFVNALRNGLSDEAMVGPYLLFAQQLQSVIGRADGAVVMLLAGCRPNLAIDQWFEGQTADHAGAFLGRHGKRLFVRRVILHASDLLCVELPVRIPDLIGSL